MSDDSIRGLATTIAALKDQAGQLRTAVAAVKDTTDHIKEQLTAAGVEGGPAARLSGCSAGHERAATQLEAIEGRLERARFIAMSAINGLYGSGTLTRSGDQADDPTSWDKPTSGTELVKQDETKANGFRGLMNFLGKRGDDVADVANSSGKLLDIGWKSVGHEPTPTTGLTMSTLAREPQIDSPSPPPKAGMGSLLLASFTLTLVGAKTSEAVGNMAHRMWKARDHERE